MAVPYFLLWIFYVLLTLEDRNRYLMAVGKNMDCVGSRDASKILYGSVTEYTFNPNAKPQRRYMTWSEFWKQKGY